MKRLERQAYYPVGEAARQLGIKISTVKQYLRTGRLHGRKENTKGFREEWRVHGASILDLRKKLGLDGRG